MEKFNEIFLMKPPIPPAPRLLHDLRLLDPALGHLLRRLWVRPRSFHTQLPGKGVGVPRVHIMENELESLDDLAEKFMKMKFASPTAQVIAVTASRIGCRY